MLRDILLGHFLSPNTQDKLDKGKVGFGSMFKAFTQVVQPLVEPELGRDTEGPGQAPVTHTGAPYPNFLSPYPQTHHFLTSQYILLKGRKDYIPHCKA